MCGVSSSYAFTASASNALKLENAREFEYNYVPLKSTSLKAGGTIQNVSNTVDRTNIPVQFFYENNFSSAMGQKYLGSSGHFVFSDPQDRNINFIRFKIPRSIIPSYGTFKLSLALRCDVSPDILSCNLYGISQANGANAVVNTVVGNSKFVKSYGDLYLAPTTVTLENFDYLDLRIYYNQVDPSSMMDGYLYVRFEYTSDTSGATVVGEQFDNDSAISNTANNTAQISQNTADLVYSQNETNGLLEDIIQHISDQLAAMWDQLYNLMAVPWIQNDNLRTNNTIDAIEENASNTNLTIEEQSSWHANFIIEGLKSLFIPSSTYFGDTISSLFDWFEVKFGFLGYTLTYFIRLLNGIIGASQNTVIRFPGITVPNRATNEVYQILPAQNVDIAQQISLISENDFNLLEFMRTAGDIVLVLGFIVMLQNKLHEVESR